MNNNTTNNSIAMPEDVLPMREKLKDRLLELMPEPQRVITAVDGLNLLRRDAPTLGESCFYRPLIGFTIQGRKHSMVASNEYDYGDGQYLVTGVDMPSINEIREASSDRPYLAISLTLDRYLITQLATEVPPPAHSTPDVSSGVGVDNPTPELMDSVHRAYPCTRSPNYPRNPLSYTDWPPWGLSQEHQHPWQPEQPGGPGHYLAAQQLPGTFDY